MFANFLIGLREGLEASLIIGILAAYLVKTGRKDLLRFLWAGVSIATAVALSAGAVLTLGSRELSDTAETAIAGSLSVLSVGLVTWMAFWLAKTARTMKASLESTLDHAVLLGGPAILAVALLTVGREGLETALFLWANITAAGTTAQPLAGALIGIAVAIGLGALIARGAVRLNLRVFFRWTGVALLVVAAGVLAYGVGDLQEAGLLPGATTLAFDISASIPESSWYGTLLAGIFNVHSATTVLSVVAYFAYIVPALALYLKRTAMGAPRAQGSRVASSRAESATREPASMG